jgi:GH25 family lysozyme M1 (1,4-beta-N-acetylmuramidase)
MIFGIDTASVAGNKNINWAKAKAEGPISFAFLRSNVGTVEDPQFSRENTAAQAVGLTTGAYAFITFPRNGKKAAPIEAQTEAFLTTLGKNHIDFPPVMDIEFPGDGISETGLSVETVFTALIYMYDKLQSTLGVTPIIYTSARVWRDDLKNHNSAAFIDSPLWLAKYPFSAGPAKRNPAIFETGKYDPPIPVAWGTDTDNWWFHQYQGDATDFPGFSGNVDMNRFNTLIKGAKGQRVKWMQNKLVNSGHTQVKLSGTFDEVTRVALTDFQSNSKLAQDGIVGPKTFAALAKIG